MAGDNEKIGGRRKKSANRTNLDPLKDKGFEKRCKKSHAAATSMDEPLILQ